ARRHTRVATLEPIQPSTDGRDGVAQDLASLHLTKPLMTLAVSAPAMAIVVQMIRIFTTIGQRLSPPAANPRNNRTQSIATPARGARYHHRGNTRANAPPNTKASSIQPTRLSLGSCPLSHPSSAQEIGPSIQSQPITENKTTKAR